jgi:hypothetical protein
MKQYVILLNGQQYQVWAAGWALEEDGGLTFINESKDDREVATFNKWDAWIDVAAVAAPAVPKEDKCELVDILDVQY